ncbi:MAG TPA: LuxR C-terminal-related transcriptional regulator, partial [Actinoplanes sp.]|nr:LuxR C-terminal-related transcriptional regulator [Actinoplanes sp.]
LAAAGETMRARGGFAGASAMLERAAGLTTDPKVAAARLAEAVADACLIGDIDRARSLGGRVLDARSGADDAARATVWHALGVMEEFGGSIPRAADLQAAAAESGTGRLRVRALAQLTMLRYRLDDAAGMLAAASRLAEAAHPGDPEQRMLAEYGLGAAQVFAGELTVGREHMRRAVQLLETDPVLRDDPRQLLFAMLAGRWLSDLAAGVPSLERRFGRARESGALGVLVPALAMRAAGMWLLGDHTDAYASAGEAVELGEALGHVSELALACLVLAAEAAARGRFEESERTLAEARDLVRRAGTADVAEHLLRVEALCALARADLNRVVACLEPRLASAGRSGHVGDRLPVAPALVEAYAGLRRTEEAAALADRYAAVNPVPRPPAVEALVARCRGLTATAVPQASAHFEAALRAHLEWPEPFEAAHTRLLYGSVLRRCGQRREARVHLRAAQEAFAAMDLRSWAERTAEELAATGGTVRRRTADTDEPLTSQETRVALLVARGMTNREVAAALFLSPKTVEHHLGRVFRKRGLRTRTELAHHLGGGGR